jgi:hypothetical protein
VAASEGEHGVRASDADPDDVLAVGPDASSAFTRRHASEYGAVIFIEPETREGRAITQRYLGGGIAEVGDAEVRGITRDLRPVAAGRKDEVVRLSRLVVSTIAAGMAPAVVTDPRILSAIDYINQHLDRPLTLDEVASHACLSPSRFRHLFSEQTSMGLRPYILWRRFMLTWSSSRRVHAWRPRTQRLRRRGAPEPDLHAHVGFAPSAIHLAKALPEPRTALLPPSVRTRHRRARGTCRIPSPRVRQKT